MGLPFGLASPKRAAWGMGAVLAPAPVRRRLACLARTPSAARVKEEGAKVAEKFSRGAERGGESFLEVSDRLDAHSGRGCNGVARGRGLHVSWELQWGSLSTVARRREGSLTNPKRVGSVVSASEGSPRCSPHGHLRVGRWAGEAEECRGSKGRHAPWSEKRWVREGKRRHGSLHAAASGRRRNACERGRLEGTKAIKRE